MDFINRLLGRPVKKNALALLNESNSELRQLLFLEKKHSADLLQQLSKALSNTSESVTKEPGNPTQKEQEVLNMFNLQEKITSAAVCKNLNYSCRQIASERLSKMITKGLIKKVGLGKLSAYVLA